MSIFQKRIQELRKLMAQENIAAYIAYHSDPHQSEYPIPFYLERQWLTGFEGSAGTVVVTADTVALWTDGRYFLQVTEEFKDWQDFQLMKMGLDETPEIGEWLAQHLKENSTVATNAKLITLSQHRVLQAQLKEASINLSMQKDLVASIWQEQRPEPSKAPAIIHDESLSGEDSSSKIEKIRQQLTQSKVDAFVISALDEIAWVFNIRGKDVSFNPVVIAFAYIDQQEAILFIDPSKVDPPLKEILTQHGVQIHPYEQLSNYIANQAKGAVMGIDAGKMNMAVYLDLPQKLQLKDITNPIPLLKGVKNETEIAGFKEALRLDGIALTQVFMWIEEELASGREITELDVMEKLYQARSMSPDFFCESFCSITGYAEHGAIVHYRANEKTNVPLRKGTFFLVDSGGQYRMGTTDITRTIYLGEPSAQEKKDYTLVLKAHIALAKVIFPAGTRGVQLDSICRQALWRHACDYPHGTGHGVGSFLNVHEGPQNIRKEDNGIKHLPGMVSSNEPGLYRANTYGIRLENLILCQNYQSSEFGEYYHFDTLTLFPMDATAIEVTLLDQDELQWLNNYHQKVYDTLAPALDAKDQQWLKNKCKPLA